LCCSFIKFDYEEEEWENKNEKGEKIKVISIPFKQSGKNPNRR
jgi:hypothetical protein